MFLSTFSAIFLSRSELKSSSFRCGSDSTLPLTPWQFTWALSHSQISLKFSPVDTNDSVSKPLSHPLGTNAFSELKGAMQLWVSSHWKKCAFILWHRYRVLQIHHVNGCYVTSQLFHFPHMQNLFILVLVLRFSWAQFENTLPPQLLPPKAVNLKFKVTNNQKQLLWLLLLHTKSSTTTSKLCIEGSLFPSAAKSCTYWMLGGNLSLPKAENCLNCISFRPHHLHTGRASNSSH